MIHAPKRVPIAGNRAPLAKRFALRAKHRGLATIELALTLPMLLVVLFGIIDFSRAIQFNNIIVHMSREGANLAARTDKGNTPRAYILDTLTKTAEPLQMASEGMMYLTLVTGEAGGRARVTEQYRVAHGKASIISRLWACPSWSGDNSCQVPGAGTLVTLPVALRVGEQVWVSESSYDYRMLSGFLFNAGPKLYSMTIL